MIRNAVIHLLNEQPVVGDLIEDPKPGDVLLVCTNLRTLDGRRPVFVDDVASTFYLPFLHIRFIEVRPERAGAEETEETAAASRPEAGEGEDLEIDEDFLRRIREA